MRILSTIWIAVLVLAAGLFGLSAFAAPQASQQSSEPTTVKSPERFKFYVRQGIPATYRGKTNPLPTNVPNVIKGADLYNARCASCHGLMGFGNGLAGGGLRPRPADLAWSLSSPEVKDDFLLWTIAEGGAQFNTSMPGYKSELREHQIWEIITYMRAAFEGREASVPQDGATKQAMADR
jgi:mono/diheme cytochrome c family protein